MHYQDLPPRTQKRARQASDVAAASAQLYREQHKRMSDGPHLAADEHTLIVPSDWYNAQAAAFWKNHGFSWEPTTKTWQRDTRKGHYGKRYTAQVWLKSTRREFYAYWPDLLPDEKQCQECHISFHPINEYKVRCHLCEAIAKAERAERRAHDETQ